eukprot:79044_1
MTVIPLKVDHLKWLHKYDTGSGESRVIAFLNAFKEVIQMPDVEFDTRYMGSNLDGKYIKSGYDTIIKAKRNLKKIQHSMWDFTHLEELAHKDMMKKVPWYVKTVNMMNKFKGRFGFGKQRELLKQEVENDQSKFLVLLRYIITRFIRYFFGLCDRYLRNYKHMHQIL